MEEDIKILEELIAGAKAYGEYEGNKYYKSMENLIARYKELEKELYRQINAREIQEKFIDHNFVLKADIKDEIEELEKMKVEGETFTTSINFAKKILHNLLDGWDLKGIKNYIPKSKIEEKIEVLRDAIQYSANPLAIDNSKYAIEVLQELLEES